MELNYDCTCGHRLNKHDVFGRCTDLYHPEPCPCPGYVPIAGRRELEVEAWRPERMQMTAGELTDDTGRPITFVPVKVLLDLRAEVDDMGGTTIVRAEKEFGSVDLDDGALMLAGLAFIDTAGTANQRVTNAVRAYLWALANTTTPPGTLGRLSPSYASLQAAMRKAEGMNQ